MQGGALSPLSRELLPQSSERHQGGERTNWELALHLGQFINWIRGHLRPQANPREAPLSPWSAVRLLGTKTGGLGSAQSFRSWESLKKVADHCTASVSPSVQWPGSISEGHPSRTHSTLKKRAHRTLRRNRPRVAARHRTGSWGQLSGTRMRMSGTKNQSLRRRRQQSGAGRTTPGILALPPTSWEPGTSSTLT